MKKWLFYLAVYVILVGCAPGDIITIERPSDSDPSPAHTATPHSPPSETATKVPLRETVTPDPAGQILDGTSWVLDHHLIEGEVRELKNYETLVISLEPERVGIYDGCNRGGYENKNGRPIYAATEKGEFVFPLGEWEADGAYSITYSTTELACFAIDEETGEEHPIGIQNFRPLFAQLVAYELSDDQLLLYYPEDKRNALVFEVRIVEPWPAETPIQTTERIITARPTQTAGPTPELQAPLLGYPSPLTPYPPPVTPYPSPATPYPTPSLSYP